MKRDIFLICFFTSFFLVFFSIVFFRLWLPHSYIFFSISISIFAVVILSQLKKKIPLNAFFFVLMLFLFLRTVYDIASNFSFVPLADSYQDYALTRILMETGKASIVTSETGFINLQYPSSWPSLHIFASSFSLITGIDALQATLILPQIFSVVIFLFVFLFFRKVVQELGLSIKTLYLSMVIYSISSDNVYTQMQFVRQSFAQVFLTIIIFYIVAHTFTQLYSNTRHKALMYLLIIILVFTHGFTPFTMLIIFASFLCIFYILRYLFRRNKFKISSRDIPISFSSLLFIAIALSIYLFSYATVIWTTQRWALNALIDPSFGIYAFQLETAITRGSYYDILRPQPFIDLLTIRDVIIYFSAAIAFIAFSIKILRKKDITFNKLFLFSSTTAFFTVFLVYDLFWGLQPFRVLWLSAPLIAIFAGDFYTYFLSKKKLILRLAVFVLIITATFTSLISPWFHYYIPLYLYDPLTRFEDVGSHNPNYLNIRPYVMDYLSLEQYESIVSDDPYLLYVILPTANYGRIMDLYDQDFLYSILSLEIAQELGIKEVDMDIELTSIENTVLFEFQYLNPSFHTLPYLPIFKEQINVSETVKILKQRIILSYNLIYDASFDKIYVVGNRSP